MSRKVKRGNTKATSPRKSDTSILNPYHIDMSRMNETDRAKLIDDALVYMGCTFNNVPQRVLLSVRTLFQRRDLDLGSEWPLGGEKLSLLRPGFPECLFTLDNFIAPEYGRVDIHKCDVLNSGDIQTTLWNFRRSGTGKANWVQTDSSVPFGAHVMADGSIRHVGGYNIEAQCVMLGCMVARLRARLGWTTYLSHSVNALGITMDHTTIKEMFRLREKPEGRSRREALLHVVSGHYRRLANLVKDRIYVESYLRGATEFEWFGLRGQIETGQYAK